MELIDRIRKRIELTATEAHAYAPITRVISEAEVKEILEQEEKPKTNADRIRSMTDWELAKWFDTVTKDVLGGSTWDKKGWLKWLRAESE